MIRFRLPHFPVPAGETAGSHLRALVLAGAHRRYGAPLPEPVRERLDHELGVVAALGFDGYFLVVSDLVAWAKSAGIRVGPGRGSSAGSCVAYCLGITAVDPLACGLLFERFLNAGRSQPPDIDVDFDAARRYEVIRYLVGTYGGDRVAQVGTVNTAGSRGAIRQAVRNAGLPVTEGDRLTGLLPPKVMGRDMPLKLCLDPGPLDDPDWHRSARLRQVAGTDSHAAVVLAAALALEGTQTSVSTHASAVVVADCRLADLGVTCRPGGIAGVTDQSAEDLERAGLVKLDILGLRTLTVIEHTVAAVAASTGARPDPAAAPPDDPAVYAALCSGSTAGVFQLESAGMTAVARRLAPTCLDDLAALLALYRPGPMGGSGPGSLDEYLARRSGAKPAKPPHPALAGILSDTLGVLLYQEQTMQVAQVMAGFGLEQADDLRRAASHKDRPTMAALRTQFVAGCARLGHGPDAGEDIFALIESFADYGFVRSHAYAYAMVTYQTAWLKVHYPAEFMASTLDDARKDKDKLGRYLSECRRLGVGILPPDVNHSELSCRAAYNEGSPAGEIRLGLHLIKGVPSAAAERIVEEVASGGPFVDLADLCQRIDPAALSVAALRPLAAAGALDFLGPRAGLYETVDEIVKAVRRSARLPVISDHRWTPVETALHERGLLGRAVSVDPMAPYRAVVADKGAVPLIDLVQRIKPTELRIAGMVVQVSTDGPTGTLVLDDDAGTATVEVLAHQWEQLVEKVHLGTILGVRGIHDPRKGKVRASAITVLG